VALFRQVRIRESSTRPGTAKALSRGSGPGWLCFANLARSIQSVPGGAGGHRCSSGCALGLFREIARSHRQISPGRWHPEQIHFGRSAGAEGLWAHCYFTNIVVAWWTVVRPDRRLTRAGFSSGYRIIHITIVRQCPGRKDVDEQARFERSLMAAVSNDTKWRPGLANICNGSTQKPASGLRPSNRLSIQAMLAHQEAEMKTVVGAHGNPELVRFLLG